MHLCGKACMGKYALFCVHFLYLIYDHVALCGCPKMRTKTMAINTLAHSSRAHRLQSCCFWTRENPCSGLCLISTENWMIQTESASPIWRHLKGDLLWSPTPRGLPEVQEDEQPFQKTCYLIFFLGPMCRFPVKLKALRGGGSQCAGSLAQQQLLDASVQLNIITKWTNRWYMPRILWFSELTAFKAS